MPALTSAWPAGVRVFACLAFRLLMNDCMLPPLMVRMYAPGRVPGAGSAGVPSPVTSEVKMLPAEVPATFVESRTRLAGGAELK